LGTKGIKTAQKGTFGNVWARKGTTETKQVMKKIYVIGFVSNYGGRDVGGVWRERGVMRCE